MAAITLNYDNANVQAQNAIDNILASGLFRVQYTEKQQINNTKAKEESPYNQEFIKAVLQSRASNEEIKYENFEEFRKDLWK